MLSNDYMIKVTNRDNGTVGYEVPDLGVKRNFVARETKEITWEELKKLSYVPGGSYILSNCLIIQDEAAIKELLGEVEPEYFYTEKDVENLLLHDSLDALMDCLDFAPRGTIELVKDIAVKLEIPDINKRKAILEKTGFNVTKAIEINNALKEEANEEDTTKFRRVNKKQEPKAEAKPTGRRVDKSKYTILSE